MNEQDTTPEGGWTRANWPAERWPNFAWSELACRYTQINRMSLVTMDRLQTLRLRLDKPLRIGSGYRDPTHPAEARKEKPGTHALGRAVDIAVQGEDAVVLLVAAYELGFTGFGVAQKGAVRFIHLDDATNHTHTRPALWSY